MKRAKCYRSPCSVSDAARLHRDDHKRVRTGGDVGCARFGLGEDPLQPYKRSIDRWLWPDVLRRQDTSVSKAKQAISEYKRRSVIPKEWPS
jgi:hypothetical protein